MRLQLLLALLFCAFAHGAAESTTSSPSTAATEAPNSETVELPHVENATLIIADIAPNASTKPDDEEKAELLLVQTVWRHGIRTPLRTYPNDPNEWKEGLGKLTKIGKEQMFRLGVRLRQHYSIKLNFTSRQYEPSEIYIRSSDTDRTLISAGATLVGFYKQEENETQNDPLRNLIPIHTVPLNQDHVAFTWRKCDRSDALWRFVADHCPQRRAAIEKYKNLTDTLTTILGETKPILFNDIYEVTELLEIEKFYGRPWPANITESMLNESTAALNVNYGHYYGIGLETCRDGRVRNEMTRVRGGALLSSLIDRMQAKMQCLDAKLKGDEEQTLSALKNQDETCEFSKPLKFVGISGHDITLSSLFATFGFNNTDWNRPGEPHFAACVALELWRHPRANRTEIRALYFVPPESDRDAYAAADPPVDLTSFIEGCERGCTLEEFVQRSERYKLDKSPTDYCADTNLQLLDSKGV